jgi:uncharacterized protein (DUF2141 family)
MFNFRISITSAIIAAGVSMGLATPVGAGIAISNDLSRCGASSGPAVLVTVTGLKSASGKVRLQSYVATQSAWLGKGKWLNRIETTATGKTMTLCMPVSNPGKYGFAMRHDRNGNGKTDFRQDGGGFSNNPKLSIWNLGKPSVGKVAFTVGQGVTRITINMQYF